MKILEVLKKWLDDHELTAVAKNNFVHYKNVLKQCLRLKEEHVLVVGDYGYPNKRVSVLMAAGYYYAAKKLGLNVDLVMQQPKIKGDYADEEVVERLLDMQKESAIVLCLSNKLGKMGKIGKSFRRFSYTQGHRFISAPGLGSINSDKYIDIVESIGIDYKKLQEEQVKIKNDLDWGKEVEVKTKLGTDLSFSIRGRRAISNDGNYTEPGKGGNIPVGEVYIAPVESSASGKLVIDGTIKHRWGATIVKDPITLLIEKGRINEIRGGFEAKLLQRTFDWAETNSKNLRNVKMLGEFGIGTNPKARLIGATIVDEKVKNTAHIAFGSNYWFGGDTYSIIHLDQIFKDPVVKVDGKKIG